MKYLSVKQLLSLAITALVSVTLVTGCGGSGGSATGGGGQFGTASISGNVNGGLSFHQDEAGSSGLLSNVTEWVIPAAIAAGVAGVEVELLLNGAVVGSQTTDDSGDFLFSDLPAGSYTIRLIMGGQNVGESPPISLDANTRTELEMNLDGSVINLEVEAEENQISGSIDDDVSSDDESTDQDSVDDDSVDDDSDDVSDDDSSDDDSEDDDSSDDDESSDE